MLPEITLTNPGTFDELVFLRAHCLVLFLVLFFWKARRKTECNRILEELNGRLMYE